MTPTRLALIELTATVVLPLAILQFGTASFGPTGVLVAATIPAALFLLFQVVRDRSISALGVLALAGIGLSGLVAVLELDASMFALKEALLPLLLGGGTALTAWTRFPVLGAVLERLFDPVALGRAREAPERAAAYASAIRWATVELAVGTASPGLLAYVLARIVVQSPAGTEAFVAEVARYTAWSLPGVTVPGVIVTLLVLRRTIGRVETALGVPFDSLLPELVES